MKTKYRSIYTYILLALAVAMCIYGALSSQAAAVWQKAVNICMECIGLG